MVKQTSSYGPAMESLRGFTKKSGQHRYLQYQKGMAVSELSQNTIVTPALEIDQYPLPHPEDLMAGQKFSKLHELVSSLSANDP